MAVTGSHNGKGGTMTNLILKLVSEDAAARSEQLIELARVVAGKL
jgi:hypothetical protein